MYGIKRTVTTILAFAAGVFSLLVPTSLAVAAEGSPNELFRSVDARTAMPSHAASVPIDEVATRRRMVSIDIRMLDRAQRSAARQNESALNLNLFDDVSIVGVVEQTAPTFSGGYSLTGRIAQQPLSIMTLVINGNTVAGSVRTLDGTYRISSVRNGIYAVSEVDVSALALDCEVLE